METKAFREWIGRIYGTNGDELDCNETQTRLSAYVDAELQGATQDTAVADHLHQCPDCSETYEGLRYLARLELNGAIDAETPATDELTPVAGS